MTVKGNHKSGFAPVFRGSLYYEVAGSGKTILLIHAGIADCTMWAEQFDLLSQSYQVIRYDARGYGRSRTDTTEFSNRQDILDLFKHLGVNEACIIGISRGGQIAIDFTIEHPECVTALVPVAAGISGYEFQPGDDPKAIQEEQFFSHMDDLWDKKAWDELADQAVHAWGDGLSQPVGRASAHIRDYIHKNVKENFARSDGQATPIKLDPPAIKRLSEIKQPTLIIIGEYDTCATQAAADELECQIPLSRKVGIPGVAHMIPMERPDLFNQVVSDFLKEVL